MPRNKSTPKKQSALQIAALEFTHLGNTDTAASSAQSSDNSQGTSKKKKRKRRGSEDGVYSKRGTKSGKTKSGGKPENILHMRADTSLTVQEDDMPVEKKTAVILRSTPLRVKRSTTEVLQERFIENQSKIPTNRPVEEVTQSSDNGTPLQIRTPGNSLLPLTSKNGFMYGFSNVKSTLFSPLRTVAANFSSTSPATHVKPNPHSIKHVKTFITPDSLRLADLEIRANGGQRSISQNALMAAEGVAPKKAAASKYAHAAELSSKELRWEWLHLIAHFALGSKAQNEHNLGIGTAHANTEMLGAELALRDLVKMFPQGFWLDAKAHFIPGKQVLTTIEYTITTEDFVLPFVFNAQQKNKPDIYNLAYIKALIDTFKEIKAAASEVTSEDEAGSKLGDEKEGAAENDENDNSFNLPPKTIRASRSFRRGVG